MGIAAAFGNTQHGHKRGRLKRAALVALMALTTITGMAQAQQAGPAPAPSALQQGFNQAAAPAIPADLTSYMSNPADAAEITALKADFAKTQFGINLLRFCQQHDIQFRLDPTLGARHNKAEYSPATGNILIRPGLKPEGLVMYTAHEIRHGWQDKVLHALDMEVGVMTPWQRWTLRRYLEADAEAFSGFFEADRLNNGVKIGAGFAEAMPESSIAMRLRFELASSKGLNYGTYRKAALEPSLAALHTYNTKQLDLIEDATLNFGMRVLAAGNDKAKLAALEEQVRNAPTDAQFEALLRHFGGTSFDVNVQTSLGARVVSAETLLQTYPRLEANPDIRESFPTVLDKSIADMTALQDGYIRVLHNASGMKAAPKPGA